MNDEINRRPSFSRRYAPAIVFTIILIVFILALNLGWPYVISKPGSASPVHPRVETNHKLDEKGALLFTTVYTQSRPNAFALLYAWLNPRQDIQPQDKATGGTTNLGAYRNLMAWMRDSSEANALLASFNAMNKPIDAQQEGVIILSFSENSLGAANGLQEGDIITSVDGKPTLTFQLLSDYLNSKRVGDKVKVAGNRGTKTFEATVPLVQLDNNRVGIGFLRDTVLKVTPPEPVKFDFNDTGGPSAGLMMTLEIIAQLTDTDLTKGYRIAGTGTIDANGNVGQIGGIQYKLMASESEKADYFLVPYVKDVNYGNWNAAQKAMKDYKLSPKMKLVPIASLKEALDFLQKLPDKAS